MLMYEVNTMITKKLIWIPFVIVAFSFLSEYLVEYFSFLTHRSLFWMFWIGIGFFAILTCIELVSILHTFANERFRTPRKKLEEVKERIDSERKKIKEVLDFDLDNEDIHEVIDHYYGLEEYDFSKEALAPFAVKWFAHAEKAHQIIHEDKVQSDIEHHQSKIDEKKKELADLKQQKKAQESDERAEIQDDKDTFLEDYHGRLQIHAEDLNSQQEQWLIEEGFQKAPQWCIEHKKSEDFFIKTRHNESVSHAYLCGAIHHYIVNEGLDHDAKLLTTKDADIVFNNAGFQWAFEVETGKVHQKSKKQLQEKVNMLNEKYGKDGWFFVVTNKNLLAKYRKFGPAIDRKSVTDKIEEIFFPDGIPEDTP